MNRIPPCRGQERRMHMPTASRAAVVLAVCLLVGCTQAAPEGTVAQPQFDGGDGAMTALIDGSLAGDPDREGGCVWLEDPNGDVAAIAWEFPTFLRAEDMTLVDEHGDVLAHMGDRVRLGGGYAHGESVDRCMVSDSLVKAWDLQVLPSEATD